MLWGGAVSKKLGGNAAKKAFAKRQEAILKIAVACLANRFSMPLIPDIASALNCHPRGVVNAIHRLEKNGAIRFSGRLVAEVRI